MTLTVSHRPYHKGLTLLTSVDGVLCTTECANGTRVWTCRHIDGTVSLVLNKPERGTAPKVYRGR